MSNNSVLRNVVWASLLRFAMNCIGLMLIMFVFWLCYIFLSFLVFLFLSLICVCLLWRINVFIIIIITITINATVGIEVDERLLVTAVRSIFDWSVGLSLCTCLTVYMQTRRPAWWSTASGRRSTRHASQALLSSCSQPSMDEWDRAAVLLPMSLSDVQLTCSLKWTRDARDVKRAI